MLNLRAIFDEWFHFLLCVLPVILTPYFMTVFGNYGIILLSLLYVVTMFKDMVRIDIYKDALDRYAFTLFFKYAVIAVLSLLAFKLCLDLTTIWFNLTFIFLGMLIINDVIFLIDHLISEDQGSIARACALYSLDGSYYWEDHVMYLVFNFITILALTSLIFFQIIPYSFVDPMLLTTGLTFGYILISSLDYYDTISFLSSDPHESLIHFWCVNIFAFFAYPVSLFHYPSKTVPIKSLINFYNYVSSGELIKNVPQCMCMQDNMDSKKPLVEVNDLNLQI